MVRRHKNNKLRRKIRTRAKIKRFSLRPRLIVFRSLKHIYGQIIDKNGLVLASASEKDISVSDKKNSKTKRAFLVGQALAKKALKKKIKEITFDRGEFRYHGRVKSFAEGARKGGLGF